MGTDAKPAPALDPRVGSRRGPSAVAWLVLVVGITITTVGAQYWDHLADEDRQKRFTERADDVHEDARAQLDRYHAALVATSGLFDASTTVTADEFTLFVERLDLTNYEGVTGISFVVPVASDQLDVFDASRQLLGAEDFEVRPPSPRARHDVVTFSTGDAFELGYDLATIRHSRVALEEARDTGQTVASSPHDLPTEDTTPAVDPPTPGIAIFTPMYRTGASTDTAAARRAALLGWLATPVVRAEFVASTIGRPDSLGVEFVGVDPDNRLVAQYPSDLPQERAGDAEFVDERAFDSLGRRWQLRVESLPGFGDPAAAAPITLLGGIVIAVLMFLLVWALSRASERRRVNTELAHQALHDPLTGLANRRLFLELLEESLNESARVGGRIAVFFIDLDHFKVVNDSLGHEAGNELIVETARRLETLLGSTDRVARLGGDEFAVLRDDVPDGNAALAVAHQIAAALRVPYMGSDRDLFVPASVGVALSVPDDPNADALLRNADLAMYRAKKLGRDRSELFDDALHHQVVNRLESEIALHHALDHHEFVVFYQPEVSAADGRVVAAEALLRWWHPEVGPIAPGDFINIAEETGLIVPLGTWVLNEACRQAVTWRRELGDAAPPVISVNVSARQVARPDLAAGVARALEANELEPGALRLEITENVLVTDTRSSMETIAELHELGVHLGIDDFGTGYSSLSYLQRFPVDTLKIDRSFVHALGGNRQSRAIVGSVIYLAHSLDLRATAEGVETRAQLDELRALDCDHVQGNLLAPPQPAASFRRLLETTPRLGPE
jgi:diguanylate cyclase (GGDEF)-like protein